MQIVNYITSTHSRYIKFISLGGLHVCIISVEHNLIEKLFCIGDNSSGQLQIPDDYHSDILQFDTGYEFTCAIKTNLMKCWGKDNRGQLQIPSKLFAKYSLNNDVPFDF